MRLGDLCALKTKFEDADFWIARRGTKEMVGKPTRTYNPEHIGIKVIKTDVLDPNYLYHLMEYLWGKGFFSDLAFGSLRLVHIRIDDLARLQFRPR